MFKALLYKLAYPLFAKEVEAYHRLNNAVLGINRWCASDHKANVISTHLLQVRDDLVTHYDDSFRERLRAIDKLKVAVTTDDRTTSVTQARSKPPKQPYERPESSKEFPMAQAIQQAQQAAIANDNPFRKDCGSTPHEAAWSGSDDSCSSSSGSSSSSSGD